MSDIAPSTPAISPLNMQAERLLRNPNPAADDNKKIDKAARDFESILLSSWLQQAEESFATVPGGDGDEDSDAGKQQLQGIAVQALGGALAASGGIGIAKMIARQLHKTADLQSGHSTAKLSTTQK